MKFNGNIVVWYGWVLHTCISAFVRILMPFSSVAFLDRMCPPILHRLSSISKAVIIIDDVWER